MSDNKKLAIKLFSGKSKKGNEYTAVKVCIGDWEGMIFPRTTFEMNYIKQILQENK